MSDKRKLLWPWIVALLIGLPVLYVASFGPACWLCENEVIRQRSAWLAYRPVGWAFTNGPRVVQWGIVAYASIWSDERRISWGMFPHLGRESKSPLDYEIWHDFWDRKSR